MPIRNFIYDTPDFGPIAATTFVIIHDDIYNNSCLIHLSHLLTVINRYKTYSFENGKYLETAQR